MPQLLLFALTAVAGALSVFAFAPWRMFWLMPLLLAALAELAERRPASAFGTGYAWGLAAYTANFYWIYISLHHVAGLPSVFAAPLTLLLPAYLALYPGLAVWLSCRMAGRAWLRWLVAFPAAFTLGEWLRGWMLTGFPWGTAGYSQITESPLSGLAPVGGIYLVTWAVALSAGVIVVFARVRPRTRVVLLALMALVWGGGYHLRHRSWTQPVGEPVSVALAQGNVPQSLKWDPQAAQDTLALYYRQVATTRTELMILPETALPLFLEDLPSGYLTMLKGAAERNGTALAVGVPRRGSSENSYYNAVVALTQPGAPAYAKNHLVPFGEFVPLPELTGWLYQYMNMPLSGFSRGGAFQPPIEMAGQKIAFNVCYEDSFGEELIAPAREATLLANVSNLAWFGESAASSQHLQLSQARALETGRYMVRATNTGMTAIVRPDGEVEMVAAPDTRQVLVGTVQGRTGLTPYMIHGDTPILAAMGLLLLIAAVAGWRQRSQSPAYRIY
ncbi:Apolipoprotein N-acyltransferase [Gulbenkiania indica]|uniref:Apolipoprotein N-acyltransferase n=1 Tax=Gulbenkiania indica TaxID=375574 RepID=A0A0K6GZ75_9NEIS|nr:apolipoprotein N-acyltransferase [Gulbenkiania indica]CUA84027.1 Apolipoprotein N-acyltransferase [Gulbenkiania indica]